MRLAARRRALGKIFRQPFNRREWIADLVRHTRRQMAKRHQFLFAGHRLQQLFPRATIAAEPELGEDRCRCHQRGGAQHDDHIPLPAGLRGIQLTAIKGDKNHLRDGGLSQGAVAAIHHAPMVAAGRIERAKLAIDLHGRLRLAKPPPARLFANRQRTHLRGAVERLAHLLRIAVSDDGAIVISHREPQDARLPGHLFQQGLQLRVMHPHSHADARAGLQRADKYAPLLLNSVSGGGRLTTVIADDHRGE